MKQELELHLPLSSSSPTDKPDLVSVLLEGKNFHHCFYSNNKCFQCFMDQTVYKSEQMIYEPGVVSPAAEMNLKLLKGEFRLFNMCV